MVAHAKEAPCRSRELESRGLCSTHSQLRRAQFNPGVERLPDPKQEIQFELRTIRRKCRVRLDLNDPWLHLLGPTLPASQEVDELVDKPGVAELNVQMPQPFSVSAAGVADSFLSLSALPAPRQLVERGISVT